jgi:transposase InsO family protein
VREQLRLAFVPWGQPAHVLVDNRAPWGSTGDFSTKLSLWLIGLGIAMHWTHSRRPQENGVVERSQGMSDRGCEPYTCATPEELQARLERMDHLHREVYPYRERLSRRDYFPGLKHSGRPYDRDSEATL